jgi:hypothetical protein
MSVAYNSLGIHGKCIKLNRANNEYLRIANVYLFQTSPRFYTFWYCPLDSSAETILSASSCSDSNSLHYWYLHKDSSNNLIMTYEFIGGTVVNTNIGTLTLGQWQFICIGTTSKTN